MSMNQKPIVVPKWYRMENPALAGMCDLINFSLELNPNMSLAEFAKVLNDNHVQRSYERMDKIVKRQFGEEIKSEAVL